jgi:hypothetical protein
LTSAQRRVIDSAQTHWVVSGAPRSGKSTALAERVRRLWQSGLEGERVLILTPDRRAARRLNASIGQSPEGATGRIAAMSYHSFAQDLIRRWWPLVMQRLEISATTPEFLPFNLAQFACLNEYRANPGNLQRLTIREQRLIVQVLSNMNLSAANGLTLDEGWERVAFGLGVSANDEVIRDGLSLTERFRVCCLQAGVLPVDMQIEAAGWLLGEEKVRADALSRYDLIALDDLDEFVPLMAERLTSLSTECSQSVVVCGEDGGLRWLLGASIDRAREICAALVERGTFERASFTESLSESPVVSEGSAIWLARIVAGETAERPLGFAGWHSCDAHRPDEMARQVVSAVARQLDDGIAPHRIALLIPYMDTLVSTEISRLCKEQGIPFRVDRRWQSILDDPLARACLTALRCVNPDMSRKATLVEVADLLVVLTECDPITVQPWARAMYHGGSGGLRMPCAGLHIPRDALRLANWGVHLSNRGNPHQQLELLANRVFAPHESLQRAALIRTCFALANEARRFIEAAPRLGLEEPYKQRFFDYVDSDVVAADTGADPPEDSVVLTTPYAFLTSGRTATHQCWLDVASPSWWEPPLLLLTNPHALSSGAGSSPLTFGDDERIRGEVLGRIIRNLAARCDGEIHTFASFTGSDGTVLEGPLYDCLLEMQAVPA